MALEPEDIRSIHEKEQTEKRLVDLIAQYPNLADQGIDTMLDGLYAQWDRLQNPFSEFIYHIALLGGHQAAHLVEERIRLQNEENEGDGEDYEMSA